MDPALAFEPNRPKALDIFILETLTGDDSRARRYVVHNVDGDQEPILIFHTFEHKMTVDRLGNTIMLSISPHNRRSKYLCSIKLGLFAVSHILIGYEVLNKLGLEGNLQDLEAMIENIYPPIDIE